MKKLLFTLALLLMAFLAHAATLINGIYYNLNSSTNTAEVTSGSNKYTGDISIPSTVSYNGCLYSVTSIGRSAFYNCDGLTSVTIPNSVTSIGAGAFKECESLTSIDIPNSVTSIGRSTFCDCSGLTSVTIGNSVTSIGGEAFCGCSSLTSVTIPNSVTSIGYEAFWGCSSLTSVIIPNSVTSIGDSAFCRCSGLTSVSIPNGVTSIGDWAFSYCEGLTSVTIGNNVTSIGWATFAGCSGLTSVNIGNSVTSIGEEAFYGCTNLTSVTIPDSVTYIGELAFAGCTSLTSVNIGYGVTSIGERAFSGCDGLTSVTIGNNVTSIGDGAFYRCTGLTSVTFPDSVTSIGERAFAECTSLTSVDIPNSLTRIGKEAFWGCSNLTSVTIPNSVTSIESETFGGCSGLTSVTIGNGVTSIGEGAFEGCDGIKSIDIPNSVTRIGYRAFDGCSGLTSVTIGNSVTSIGNYAFYGCSGLTSVTIGNSVTSIGEWAFSMCKGLTSVTMKNPTPIQISYKTFPNYKNATLHVPQASIPLYQAANVWKDFKEIVGFWEGSRVYSASLFRGLDRLHVVADLSDTEGIEAQLKQIAVMKSATHELTLLNAYLEGSRAHFYFNLPPEAGAYTLRVTVSEPYEKTFVFDDNELFVIAQAPLTGVKGAAGYTDIAFNEDVASLPLSGITLTAPSGKSVTLNSVTPQNGTKPHRLRIAYPRLEEAGRYRLCITRGLKANGKTMAYDFESSIELPGANLVPQNVGADGDSYSGRSQTVRYTVSNNGSVAIEGESEDAVWLSTSTDITGDAVELCRHRHAVSLKPGENAAVTLPVVLPAVAEGRYHLIVKCNSTQALAEQDYDDNVLASDPFSVVVEELTDANRHFTLGRGASKLFKVPATSGKNLEVTDRYGTADLYLSTSAVPTDGEIAGHGLVTWVNDGLTGHVYLYVANNGKDAKKEQECLLKTRYFDLDIAEVGRREVVRHKTVWIPVEVTGCSQMPVFSLHDRQGKSVDSKRVHAKTATTFYALFDTRELQPGTYSLQVESGGRTGRCNDAVTVSESTPQPQLSAHLFLPQNYTPGTDFTARIQYENTGNVDVPIPLFVLSGTAGSHYQLEGEGSGYDEEIHLAGVNGQSVVGALLPGEGGSINVTVNNRLSTADYVLRTVAEGNDGIDEPFYLQWLGIDPETQPEHYTAEEWQAYCQQLRNNVGDTWSTFLEAMGMAAELAYNNDNVRYDARTLYALLKGCDLTAAFSDKGGAAYQKQSRLREYDEPGTIYLFTQGRWQPLVEVQSKKGDDVTWKRTDVCSQLGSYFNSDFYIISHGMNNDHNDDWEKNMAQKLTDIGGKVLCVDWGKWAFRSGFLPLGSAFKINDVVKRVHAALNLAFNGSEQADIRLERFHLIGHSHGAHVLGRLTRKYKVGAKRLTALDMSEEAAHLPWVSKMDERFNVQYIDYYKSSVICGTEWLVGDDNFILASGDGLFNIDISKEVDRHGYSIKWFTSTIGSNTDLGFNWMSRRVNHPKVITRYGQDGHCGWSGVINGPRNVIEDYTRYQDITDWRYTKPWYGMKEYSKKANEWDFRAAIGSTFDYQPKSVRGKESVQAGAHETLTVAIDNHADNYSVSFMVRHDLTTQASCHALYVARKGSGTPRYTTDMTDYTTYVSTPSNLHYLGQLEHYESLDGDGVFLKPFTFNIDHDLWKQLGGTDDTEELECDFWVIAGVDRTGNFRKDAPGNVKLWKGELHPKDNCQVFTLKVKKPELSCDAGADQVITLQKGQRTANVRVSGKVLKGNGSELSYRWNNGASTFASSLDGSLPLGVGTHPLRFTIQLSGKNKDKRRAPSAFAECSDEMTVCVKPYVPYEEESKSMAVLVSCDPNEKIGYNGAGGKGCVRPGETMEYSIYFENDAEKAQLPAKRVIVTDTLDTALDLSTFEFVGTRVANRKIDLPTGKSEVVTITDLRPEADLLLKTEMRLDVDSRVVTVVYTSLDTLTTEPTKDMFAGFLPPNDSTHVGEGHFTYRVNVGENVPDGYVIRNRAHITFDYNDVITTNTTSHMVDDQTPVSWVEALPNVTDEDSIVVSWNGKDAGAGIGYYDIYLSKNGAAYELWRRHVTETAAVLHGQKGDICRLYSIATDSIGLTEPQKTAAEAVVTFVGNGLGIASAEVQSKAVTIAPKVIEEMVTVSAQALHHGDRVGICLYDTAGRRVMAVKGVSEGTAYRQDIVCGSLMPGVYIIEVKVNDKSVTSEKVTKR